MIPKKIVKKIKELEIHTRRVISSSNLGGYKSSQKGFGFDFDQLRPYQYGDDVRLIDWKSSARGQGLLVRQYFEERNRTFILCLDVSASTFFGSKNVLKQEIMQQVAGVLSLAAEYSKDKVGLILFSDKIEKEIPPARGKQHIHSIIETIFSYKPTGQSTNMNILLEHTLKKVAKNSVLFLISDFITEDFESSLKKVISLKEVIAISCADFQEQQLANVGLIWMQDPETQEKVLVDTRRGQQKFLSSRLEAQKKMFQKHQVDFLHIQARTNFIHDLVLFFQKRLMY